jgi:CheY-like chemotaxis protein
VNAILAPLISAKEEKPKRAREELQENELEIMKDELRNELEIIKDDLMGMISHVIRTPLTVVKESLSLMLEEIPGKLNPKQKELLSTGKENVDGLIQSVEEIFEKSWNEIVHPAEKYVPAKTAAEKQTLTAKKRILIVEDQPPIVNMLKMRLEAHDYEVITAGDGQEGLERAQKENPSLIILDVMLPKLSGYKVCQLLKADPKYSSIPIIISSGRTPQEIKKVSQEVGADAHVSKPFEAEVLLSKMKELLEKKGRS